MTRVPYSFHYRLSLAMLKNRRTMILEQRKRLTGKAPSSSHQTVHLFSRRALSNSSSTSFRLGHGQLHEARIEDKSDGDSGPKKWWSPGLVDHAGKSKTSM